MTGRVAAEETLACVLDIGCARPSVQPEAAMRLIEALRGGWPGGVGDPCPDVSQRLAAEVRAAGRAGAPDAPAAIQRVVLPGPWSEMAARLGTTPESLPEAVALEEEGDSQACGR